MSALIVRYSNRTEAQRDAYLDVYLPLGELKIARTISDWLFKKHFGVDDRIIVDKTRIDALKDVNKDLSDRVVNEFRVGLLDRNEAREKLPE